MLRIANNSPIAVVDASVAVRWYLLDENLVPASRNVLNDIRSDRVDLIVPDHFQIEVGNAIRNALRAHRITLGDARMAMMTLSELPAEQIPLERLMIAGFDAAVRYDCALYDALYLALAEELGCPFVHADRRLRNTLGGRFERELWIEDYVTAQ